jgi:hypothetical protein
MVTLTPPGEIYRRDFRSSAPGEAPSANRPVKLLQFNIERGYQLPGIIEELRGVTADVLALQEVDVGCDRSGGVDTGAEIAAALGLNYLFLSEFEELRSPLRCVRDQGGGMHGNAILTKYDVLEAAVVKHRQERGIQLHFKEICRYINNQIPILACDDDGDFFVLSTL